MNFLAIDFETANYFRNSACAVGLVRVENKKIVKRKSFLIKPPENWFVFSYLHGITWEDVKNRATFDKLWPKIRPYFRDVDFVVAHNSSFDKSVLKKSCEHYGLKIPSVPFHCTVQLARNLWGIYPTKLPDVCDHFSIPLNHHDALSDTEACAQIMLRAIKERKFKYELA